MSKRKQLYFAQVNRAMHGVVNDAPGTQKRVAGDGDVALLDDIGDPPKAPSPVRSIEILQPENAVEQLEEVRRWAIEFEKAGTLRAERMEKLVQGVKRAEDLLKDQAKKIRVLEQEVVDTSEGQGLRALCDQWLPVDEQPKGMDRTHFNLTALRPDEIGFRALLGANGMYGATPQARAFAESQTIDGRTQARLYEWQYLNDMMLLKFELLGKSDGFREIDSRRGKFMAMREWKSYARLTREIMRAAMDSATAGEGQEWIPTIFSAQLHLLAQADLKVASMFQWPTMPAPTWQDPVEGADAIGYLIGEATTDPESTNKIPDSVPGTNKLVLTAIKLATRIVLSREFDEDSVVPAVPDVFRRAAKALARAQEKALIDGQKSGTIDTGDAPGTTDARKAWDGFRKVATTAGTKVDINTLASTDLLAMKGAMKGTGSQDHFGVQQDDGLWIPSYSSYIRLMTLKDAANVPLFMSRDRFGSSVLESGVLGVILGSPVVISPFVREDLNASGVMDNVTTTKTGLIYVNRTAWKGGVRRVMTIRRYDELKAETDQIAVIGTNRLDFKPVFGTSSKCVSFGYNVASY